MWLFCILKPDIVHSQPVCKILDYGKYRFEQRKKEKENRKISVRLNDEANKKVIDAVNKGISKSKFINNAIIGCNTTNIGELRTAMTHICNVQTELELITDMTTKNEIRKEPNGLCLALKSSLSPM